MLKLFFLLGVFVGSLINLIDTPDTDDKKEEKVITINVNDKGKSRCELQVSLFKQ